MRPLRIAVWHNLPSGGGKRVLQYHLKGLAARGHTLKIWHPPVSDNDFASLAEIGEEREIPLDRLPETGHHLTDLVRHARRGPFDVRAMREHSERCAADMAKERWDILFANTCQVFGSPFIGRFVTMKKLLYLQEPHRPLYEGRPGQHWIALPDEVRHTWTPRALKTKMRDHFDLASVRLRGREEFLNAQSFNTILVNSLYSRESVLRAYGLDSRVCYLGVDTSLFRDLNLPRENFAVGVGTLGPTKNVDLAIRAIGAMPAPRPKLHWIGNMSQKLYVERMRALAASLDVEFEATVMATDEALVQLLNRATAMIYAPRLEPFGLAPLEANACGCPVVAVAEGGLRETIEPGRNGFLCSSDPAELADRLSRIFADPALAREMGRAGRALVQEKWCVESSVDRLESEIFRVAS